MKFQNFIWLCCLLLLTSSCNENNSNSAFFQQTYQTANTNISRFKCLIKTGDIITRTGNDLSSNWLCKLNNHDETYSHVGFASIEKGIIYVYHSVGGETNPDAHIRRDLLSQFANGYDNSGFGIFRFDFTEKEIKEIINQAKLFYLEKIPFDMDFDLATDDKMYCTEYVAKTIEKALHHKGFFSLDTVSGKTYIAPDAIFLHSHCHEIKRLRYF